MPKIHANGIEFYYERHGNGFPLILICGFTNHLGMWEKLISKLSNSFDVIAFDNRGAGRTDVSPPPYTIDLLADDVIGMMDAFEIKKAHMVGFSMGTAIIQSVGLRHSERIQKGVLIAPFNRLPSTAVMQAKTTAKLFETGVDPAIAYETIFPWIFSNDFLSDPKRIEKTITDLVNNPYPQTPEGYAGQLDAVIKFDLTEKLPEIETELLMIAGEEDLYTPFYCAKILEDKLPNGKLLAIPRGGHMPHMEAPKTVVEGIHAFCKD